MKHNVAIAFVRWSSWGNQPDNHGGRQNHLVFNFAIPHVSPGEWDDENGLVNQHQKIGYICQYRQGYEQTRNITTALSSNTTEFGCDPENNDWCCCSETSPCGLGDGDCDKVRA